MQGRLGYFLAFLSRSCLWVWGSAQSGTRGLAFYCQIELGAGWAVVFHERRRVLLEGCGFFSENVSTVDVFSPDLLTSSV